jgi:hypothetical protein
MAASGFSYHAMTSEENLQIPGRRRGKHKTLQFGVSLDLLRRSYELTQAESHSNGIALINVIIAIGLNISVTLRSSRPLTYR